jgi:hypothetical protein
MKAGGSLIDEIRGFPTSIQTKRPGPSAKTSDFRLDLMRLRRTGYAVLGQMKCYFTPPAINLSGATWGNCFAK